MNISASDFGASLECEEKIADFRLELQKLEKLSLARARPASSRPSGAELPRAFRATSFQARARLERTEPQTLRRLEPSSSRTFRNFRRPHTN